MNTTTKQKGRHPERSSLSGKALEINVIGKKELKRFKELAGEFHYMGEGHAGGDTMRMVVEADGEWVALFLWGSAAYRLKDRDSYIGWSEPQRAQRQKLIVQNRRFVLLVDRGAHPNLASRILGQMIRELPSLWQKRFGYEPLLAETFSDIEAREGTCYKASGWLELGKTKGYSRHRADFYVPNDRPKKLWVRELRKDAAALLRAPELPPECLKGSESDADGVLPLKMSQIESLHAMLCKVKDPRAGNSIFHIGAMLSIVAMAVLSGHRNIVRIARFADRMKMQHRIALGLPRFKKGGTYRKVPSYSAIYNLLGQLDVDAFAEQLSLWLQQHTGSLPAALALDGTFIRDTVGIVCLADHETGVPRAMARASKKEGEGEDCELKAAQRMIRREKDLSHTVITADALHCQRETARDIVSRGGAFIIQAKDNQKTVHKQAALKTKELTPFLPRQRRGTDESTGATSP
jgi:hypothetical protein